MQVKLAAVPNGKEQLHTTGAAEVGSKVGVVAPTLTEVGFATTGVGVGKVGAVAPTTIEGGGATGVEFGKEGDDAPTVIEVGCGTAGAGVGEVGGVAPTVIEVGCSTVGSCELGFCVGLILDGLWLTFSSVLTFWLFGEPNNDIER